MSNKRNKRKPITASLPVKDCSSCECDPLPGDFIDHDVAGVLASATPRFDGGGPDTDNADRDARDQIANDSPSQSPGNQDRGSRSGSSRSDGRISASEPRSQARAPGYSSSDPEFQGARDPRAEWASRSHTSQTPSCQDRAVGIAQSRMGNQACRFPPAFCKSGTSCVRENPEGLLAARLRHRSVVNEFAHEIVIVSFGNTQICRSCPGAASPSPRSLM